MATGWLAAFTPVTPGSHIVNLSIFDRSDQLDDSTVLFNGLSFFTAASSSYAGGTCLVGLEPWHADTTTPAVTLQTPAAGSGTSAKPSFGGSFATDYEDLP